MTSILMVLTSHHELGSTGRSTGWYLPEVAHPWKAFTAAGFAVDFVSPKGGVPAYDGYDDSDPEQVAFLTKFAPDGPLTMTPGEVDRRTSTKPAVRSLRSATVLQAWSTSR
jgi:putative intracellular protease/amidase